MYIFKQLNLLLYHIITLLSFPRLADCKVTDEWVELLAFGLKFPHLPLRDLDLSNNDLTDSGVKLLCDGLSSQCCRLKTLRYVLDAYITDNCRHVTASYGYRSLGRVHSLHTF